MRTLTIILIASQVAACELDVPDLNNPGLDDLEENPTAVSVSSACTGLIIGNRRNVASANGYISQMGILGRESYNFDQADPRYVFELLEGPLNSGSPFGGNFWQQPYANIRLANIIQKVVDRIPEFSDEQKAAVLGFSNTIEALDLLEVINARDTNGAVIDTDKPITEPGAIADKPAVLDEIERLLDDAATALAAGGESFPFDMSEGYRGFNRPATFLQFNRAIRARVAAYSKDYVALKAALDASFIDVDIDIDLDLPSVDKLNIGVYHSHSTGSGDTVNALTNPNIYAHKSIVPDAKTRGTVPDHRLTRKVAVVGPDDRAGGAQGLSSDLRLLEQRAPNSRVAIIRNEELILLRAEQLFFGTPSDVPGALMHLNLVRQASGGLNPLGGAPNAMQFTTELLYDRRYSLLFEGHRLIDMRRFERTAELPLDKPNVSVLNIRWPIPLAECNARPGEPRCDLSSQ